MVCAIGSPIVLGDMMVFPVMFIGSIFYCVYVTLHKHNWARGLIKVSFRYQIIIVSTGVRKLGLGMCWLFRFLPFRVISCGVVGKCT